MQTTLILVHGAGWAGRMWRRPARRLVGRYRVIAPDMQGFRSRSSEGAESFTLDGASAALIELAQQQNCQVHVVGLSLGGAVALNAVAERPDRFASLVVTGTPVAPGRFRPRLVRWYRRIPDRVARAFSDAASWRAVVAEVARIDLQPLLPQVRVPTLVICGARDRASLPDARLLASDIPAARLLVLPDLGHGWPVTAPKVFASVLTDFHATSLKPTAPADHPSPVAEHAERRPSRAGPAPVGCAGFGDTSPSLCSGRVRRV